ncbi:MAG: bifunctional 4-hydroxy-2-oxoglutarate aldolase/2-dehydro-3-deoxy-phosphogluconate aldolase [Geminicoccaceae bacterium]
MVYPANPLSVAMIPLMQLAPVIPVLRIEDPADAVPLGRALVAGGLRVLEVTLRTERAIEALVAMAKALPDAVVGAGTVLHPAQLDELKDTGCRFIVSPGFSAALVEAAPAVGIPFLPGAATPAEVMTLLSHGYVRQKFFPAEPAGGVPMLKGIGEPIPQVKFCPTGGIGPANAGTYLALKNVVCVGGSWVTPSDALAAKDWARIERLAAEAAALRPA